MLTNVPSARLLNRFLPVQVLLVLLTIFAVFGLTAPQAQESREVVEGVTNFGRVTDSYFRGGQVTPEGVANLKKMGVRTIIDLRDEESPGEAESCKENGIKYLKFPMSGHETPDDKTIKKIPWHHQGCRRSGLCALLRRETSCWNNRRPLQNAHPGLVW